MTVRRRALQRNDAPRITESELIPLVADGWSDGPAVPPDALGQVLRASRLLGADRSVANYGGGNTSAKGVSVDHIGREVATLWVKGSGSDLASVSREDFTALRLDEALAVFDRDAISDEEMVDHLARCQLDPGAPRASIETLLHAFIPAAHVHHTHPDAINVLACSSEGERLVKECFGGRAQWIEYTRPGFKLAKQVGSVVRENPQLRLIVLAKHGLVVWGESAEEAYRETIEVVNEAAEFVNSRTIDVARFGGRARTSPLDEDDRWRVLDATLPILRGAVSSQQRKILLVDDSMPAREFAESRDAGELVRVGAACPDHLVHTKRVPLWVPFDPDVDDLETLGGRIRTLCLEYVEEYRSYVARHTGNGAEGAELDPDPRVVIIQNVGVVASGPSVEAAALSRDLYQRAITVMGGAHAMGGFTSLSEADSFAVEYWPLELFKLSLGPRPRELAGQVALVTGGAGGIGRAVARRLAGQGACVVVADIDLQGAREAAREFGRLGLAVHVDATDEDAVAEAYRTTVRRFGGVDIVVSNAGIASSAPLEETTVEVWERNHRVLGLGYFLVAREAAATMRRQGRGGSIVFVGSKNALASGRNASAYSSAKAAELHLARCLAEELGPDGIRVNTVNPDAVLEGSRIWDSSWRRERAAAHGIDPDELERFYRERTALKLNVVPDDIAEAVLFLASPQRAAKSTGNVLNVDGGVAAAFTR